jgi:hypothetical protein
VCCHWPRRLISRYPRAQALFLSASGQPLVAAADGGAAAPDKLWRACLRCKPRSSSGKPCATSCKPRHPPSHSILLLLATQPHPHSTRHSTARRTTTMPPRITPDDVPDMRTWRSVQPADTIAVPWPLLPSNRQARGPLPAGRSTRCNLSNKATPYSSGSPGPASDDTAKDALSSRRSFPLPPGALKAAP